MEESKVLFTMGNVIQEGAVIRQVPSRVFFLILIEHISLLDAECTNMGFG